MTKINDIPETPAEAAQEIVQLASDLQALALRAAPVDEVAAVQRKGMQLAYLVGTMEQSIDMGGRWKRRG